MVGMRLAGYRVDHALAVAVIGRDNGDSVFAQDGIHQFAGAAIDGGDRFDGGGQAAAMPDHVRIGEVDQDEVIVI